MILRHLNASRRTVLGGIAPSLLPLAARAAPPVNTLKGGLFGGRDDTAILGYDTVAYHTDGRAVKGQDAYVHAWMGARWKFASQAHLDLFKAAPEKYAPQYGGYCAYGVSRNKLVEIEVAAFQIVDGRLLLQYSPSVRDDFNKDAQGNLAKATTNWPALVEKKGK